MNEYSNNVAIKNKYDILMSKSIDYENIIDSQRMENHENKNDLYVLKTMIPSSNKEAHEQLDLMINEYENREIEYQQNKDLYQKTLRIPSGGLRGLFYQKLLYIENNNIEYSLRVSKNINKDSLNDLDKYERRNLCKIIGVYLDNAIQEVEKIDNKKIRIDLKLDKKVFQISISNSLGKILEIEKINDKGYSTKGKKHGYGLSLVNDILKESKKITSETSITGSIFKQTVKIKI
jgi:two-component system sensor histidine kinase AgrC